jgi:hypothetical protein
MSQTFSSTCGVRRPSPGISVGALEWLRLLRTHSRSSAQEVLRRGQPRGLTATQLELSFDWLVELGVLTSDGEVVAELPAHYARDGFWLLGRMVEEEAPPWLLDASDFLATPDVLPLDILELGADFGMPEQDCLRAVQGAAGKVDAAARSAFGALGERLIVDHLRGYGYLDVEHVSLFSDSFGFDVVVRVGPDEWHLEIKSARHHSSARIFISRHEADVMARDAAWRLVLVGISSSDELESIATLGSHRLRQWLPADRSVAARWETARVTVPRSEFFPGIPEIAVDDPAAIEAAT